MQKRKVLYINDWGGWGGAEKVTLTLVQALNPEQYEPHFILGSDDLFAQTLKKRGVAVHIVPMIPMSVPDSKKYALPLFMLRFLWRLAGYTWQSYLVARRIRPDLIQTCSIQAKLIGCVVARLMRVKLLWHVQNIQPSGFRRKIVRFLAAQHFPDMIVATSQAVADIYQDVVPADRLQVNHAGLDLADFSGLDLDRAGQSLRAELGLAGEKIVVSASMIRHWKGTHIFVQAAAEVLKHCSEVTFLVVGEAQFGKDPEYKTQVVNLVHELGLAEKVRFLGFRQDVYGIIAAADCLVHCPVKSDPLPNVILEAMALQTPVVGSATGGIPEEIDDQVSGLLVEPGNAPALAGAILQILQNPALAQRLARAARQKLEAEFSSRLFAARFERIYAQILNET